MSFGEVEKHRIVQRVSEPLREIELERRRRVNDAGAWRVETAPIAVIARIPLRERFIDLLLRKPSARVSSGAAWSGNRRDHQPRGVERNRGRVSPELRSILVAA